MSNNAPINVMPDYHRHGGRLGFVGEWTANALVNFMPHPPHPRGGWDNTGN